MKKRVKKDNKFSSTKVGVLIEAMKQEFKPILEDIPSIKAKLDSTYEQVGRNTELLNRVLLELKSKVARKDFELLEKKVASLAG